MINYFLNIDKTTFESLTINSIDDLDQIFNISGVAREEDVHSLIRKYLADDETYDEWIQYINWSIHNSIPKEIIGKCNFCNGNSVNESDKICLQYYDKAETEILIAGYFFIIVIHNGAEIFSSEVVLHDLAFEFFNSFKYEKGVVTFNYKKYYNYFSIYLMEILRNTFKSMDTLDSLDLINDLKEELNFEILRAKLQGLVSDDFFEPHKTFLNSQITYFKNKSDFDSKRTKIIESREDVVNNDRLSLLIDIWSVSAKLSLSEVLRIGLENKIWDENYNIITKRNSIYGSGKSLLSSLAVTLRHTAYPDSIDYKKIGIAFCKAFNISINENTKEPYKSFSTGNPKYIKQFKKLLKI